MDMKLLAVVTPPSIYHGCSTRKTFWEEKFTCKENLFLAANMKNCGRRNVMKYKEIRGSDKYVTLDIASKFDSMVKMKITSSESKRKLERSGKGLITSLGFKTKARSQKYKKARYAIGNVSEKDISRLLRSLRKFRNYLMRRRGPNMSLLTATFVQQESLRSVWWDPINLNWYDHGGYTKMTAPYSNVNVTNEDESKCIIVRDILSQNCCTDESK